MRISNAIDEASWLPLHRHVIAFSALMIWIVTENEKISSDIRGIL
jgi:hypothetical protein